MESLPLGILQLDSEETVESGATPTKCVEETIPSHSQEVMDQDSTGDTLL